MSDFTLNPFFAAGHRSGKPSHSGGGLYAPTEMAGSAKGRTIRGTTMWPLIILPLIVLPILPEVGTLVLLTKVGKISQDRWLATERALGKT